MSVTIIARVELKYPDDEEKKNAICKPMVIPQIPEDYFTSFQTNSQVQNAASKALGSGALFNIRSNTFAHVGFLTKWRTILTIIFKRARIDTKIDMCVEQIEKEK